MIVATILTSFALLLWLKQIWLGILYKADFRLLVFLCTPDHDLPSLPKGQSDEPFLVYWKLVNQQNHKLHKQSQAGYDLIWSSTQCTQRCKVNVKKNLSKLFSQKFIQLIELGTTELAQVLIILQGNLCTI